MNRFFKSAATLVLAGTTAMFTGCSSTEHSEHAHDHHHTPPADASHGTHVAIPDKAADIFRETEKNFRELGAAIEKKDARAAHQHDDAIRTLIGAIPARASSETKTEAEALARDISEAAKGAHRSAHEDEWKEAAGHVKRGQSALAKLKATFNAD